jgi:hypothetical protein
VRAHHDQIRIHAPGSPVDLFGRVSDYHLEPGFRTHGTQGAIDKPPQFTLRRVVEMPCIAQGGGRRGRQHWIIRDQDRQLTARTLEQGARVSQRGAGVTREVHRTEDVEETTSLDRRSHVVPLPESGRFGVPNWFDDCQFTDDRNARADRVEPRKVSAAGALRESPQSPQKHPHVRTNIFRK